MSDQRPMIRLLTMCTCGDNQLMAEQPSENVFEPHLDRKTGQPCPGLLTRVDLRRYPQWMGPEGVQRLKDDLRKARGW